MNQPFTHSNSHLAKRFSACLLAVLLNLSTLVASNAAAPKPALEIGIWTGTVGGQEVMACFEVTNKADAPVRGAYYYIRHSKRIDLAAA